MTIATWNLITSDSSCRSGERTQPRARTVGAQSVKEAKFRRGAKETSLQPPKIRVTPPTTRFRSHFLVSGAGATGRSEL